MSDDDTQVVLTVDEAVAMLPDGDTIHTFMQSVPLTLIGADWSRADVMEMLNAAPENGIQLAGTTATSMDHGLCVWRGTVDHGRWVFVETKGGE